jgi:hypothetical protein
LALSGAPVDIVLAPAMCHDLLCIWTMAVGPGHDFDELKTRGAGRPAPEAVTRLYHHAFSQFGPQCLWSRRPSPHPTIGQALIIADSLRREGDMSCRALAAEIAEACHAALKISA